MISEHSDHDALAARLAAIDAEPLEDRAAAFAQLNDKLRARLEVSTGSTNESSDTNAVHA